MIRAEGKVDARRGRGHRRRGRRPERVWFGRFWGQHGVRVRTPVGEVCAWCEEEVKTGDAGLIESHILRQATAEEVPDGDPTNVYVAQNRPLHRECYIRRGVGSVGHLRRQCTCYGGVEDDPPGMTKREAARAAAELVHAIYASSGRHPEESAAVGA